MDVHASCVYQSTDSNGADLQTHINQNDVYFIAKVIHPFDAQANGELSLSIDDYVVVRQICEFISCYASMVNVVISVITTNSLLLRKRISFPLRSLNGGSYGWSEGECKGQVGWFPSAYIERQEKAPARRISETNSSPKCDATS
ncbi:hypothetical protein KPL70_014855 [Citrus sinensis]|uniref:Uncharacterized protein n=2 Tax=Citrus TaxID=2706 RepID=A0ACB8KH05_CITSI|nr:hypothetical protein CICLE_v10003804mg [Citrus x clementina]KAH9687679.1 hypothetical protein KPL70_014855 [Citrus sinensis]KAH9753687.1 hypothetical protein KPL71_015165 [Citrus sinensis]